MTACVLTETPVFGNTRYTKRYLAPGQRRVLIVLSNERPPYGTSSFDARFNVVHIEKEIAQPLQSCN